MRYAALSLAFGIAACSNPAEDAVRKDLIDPASAKFERVSECPDRKGMYSGLVNSKNRFGAYAGAMAFFTDGGAITYVDEDAFNSMIKTCFGEGGDGALEMAVERSRYVDPSRPHSQSSDISK